jgi:hypothetical protein
MTRRIEEFTRDSRRFVYFDMSGIKTNGEFRLLAEESKHVMEKHAERSVYTVINIEGMMFDTETKAIIAEWMARCKPYVKYGAVIGMDGIKKIMFSGLFETGEHDDISFAPTKEEAVLMLLRR